MLRAVLNKSWKHHPTKKQLYGHLPPILQTFRVKRARYAGHCWKSKDELIRDILLWIPTHEHTSVCRPALDGALDDIKRTNQEQLLIGTGGERESKESMHSARHHDDHILFSYQTIQ